MKDIGFMDMNIEVRKMALCLTCGAYELNEVGQLHEEEKWNFCDGHTFTEENCIKCGCPQEEN